GRGQALNGRRSAGERDRSGGERRVDAGLVGVAWHRSDIPGNGEPVSSGVKQTVASFAGPRDRYTGAADGGTGDVNGKSNRVVGRIRVRLIGSDVRGRGG